MATLDELEQRLHDLEVLFASGRAATPPVTVGELVDVPAPGSPIASAWAQEVSNRIIHRFATTAAMNAWTATDGARAVVTAAPFTEYRRIGGAWVVFEPARGIVAYVESVTNIPAGTFTSLTDILSLLTVNVVNGRQYLITGKLEVQSSVANDVVIVNISDGGNVQLNRVLVQLPVVNQGQSLLIEHNFTAAGSGTVGFKMRAARSTGTGNISAIGQSTNAMFLRVDDLGPKL